MKERTIAGELDEASREEQEVQQKIDEALGEMEEEEEQYQRLREEELLFQISEEVTALLESHRDAMQRTREIDADRTPGERPSRAERLRLSRIAHDQRLLAGRAGELADAIEAERSIVFAAMLREIERDLERIGRDLDETGGYRTGPRVQALQEDVEETLEWVLESLRKEQERRKQEDEEKSQGESSQDDSPGENRLVPDTAALLLLRRMETTTIDDLNRMLVLYPELQDAELEVDPLVLEEVLRLAERHERTTQLFTEFRRRLEIPGPDEEPIDAPAEEHDESSTKSSAGDEGEQP